MDARKRPFAQVDVFSDTPYLGNALAVVLDAQGLSDAQMQRFARWTQLAETTFILPPTPEAAAQGADYQVRIFTTAYEMPFAGHPTLGSCHAWLQQGGVPRLGDTIVQQCQAGLVRIRKTPQGLAFAAPPLQRSALPPDLKDPLLAALGLQPAQVVASQLLVNGPRYFGLLLDGEASVLGLQPDPAALKQVLAQGGCSGVGLAGPLAGAAHSSLVRRSNREARAFGRSGQAQPDLEVRMFVSDLQLSEDPVTGSFNASLAQWLMADGHMPGSYLASQGSCVGRAGRLHLEQDAQGQVWVGGASGICIQGEVLL